MGRQPADGPRYSSPDDRRRAHGTGCLRSFAAELLIMLLVGAVVVAIFWANRPESVDEADESRSDGLAHSSIASCETDAEGRVVAEVSVTNGSSEYSNYVVEVVFEAPDGTEVERRSANLLGVEAGATSVDVVTTREAPTTDVECRVRAAFRFFAGAAPRP